MFFRRKKTSVFQRTGPIVKWDFFVIVNPDGDVSDWGTGETDAWDRAITTFQLCGRESEYYKNRKDDFQTVDEYMKELGWRCVRCWFYPADAKLFCRTETDK